MNWLATKLAGLSLDAIRLLASTIYGTLGVTGTVAVAFGALLFLALFSNGWRFLSQPKGIVFSAVALLFALGVAWISPPKEIVREVVRVVVREVDPPILGQLQSQIAGLEAAARKQKEELAAQAEASRREAARAAAEARLRQAERQLAASASQPSPEPRPREDAKARQKQAWRERNAIARAMIDEYIAQGIAAAEQQNAYNQWATQRWCWQMLGMR